MAVAAILAIAAAACGDDDGDAAPAFDVGDPSSYSPEIDPADFVTEIDNPYFPLPAGASWTYESIEDDETELIEVTVTDEERTVMGVPVVVVRDTVTLDGELVEDTRDWYAQDTDGNVWYFGEETAEYEDGEVVSTAGAWEAGVDGALPGIVMWADPVVGTAYRQEYYAGEAEDVAEIVRDGASETIEAGVFDDVLVIAELNPFEPDVVEEKYYAPGVGVILEQKIQGGDGRAEITAGTLLD